MEEGRMDYAGKYNAPDYERILLKECRLAVESTMICHSPEVKEQLDRQVEKVERIVSGKPADRTVAFFYVDSSGYVNIRKPDDYVAKMIGLAADMFRRYPLKMRVSYPP